MSNKHEEKNVKVDDYMERRRTSRSRSNSSRSREAGVTTPGDAEEWKKWQLLPVSDSSDLPGKNKAQDDSTVTAEVAESVSRALGVIERKI